jgi:hypothetical protein
MAGKGFATIEIDGNREPYAAVATVTGGATNYKTREVPSTKIGGTMVKEPTGGLEFEDLEITFQDREDQGILIDSLRQAMAEWRRDSGDTRRRGIALAFYKDKTFSKLLGRLEIISAWPSVITNPEIDRSSDDPREFTVTFIHQGSSYKPSEGSSGSGEFDG